LRRRQPAFDDGDTAMKIKSIRMKRTVIAVALCSLCLAAGADHLIEVAPSLTVSGPDVLLREISANPALLPEGWGERAVMRAPEPGRRAEYSLVSIAYALQKYPDMSDVLLHGLNNIAVRRSGTGKGQGKIIQAVKSHILENPKWNSAPIDIQVEDLEEYVHIPENAEVEIAVSEGLPQREANRFLFETTIVNPSDSSRRIVPVYARIIPMVEVWTAVRPLAAGCFPGDGDVKAGLVPADAAGGYVPTTESIGGLELTRDADMNEPLSRRFMIAPVCARRGDVIEVTATHGAMTVTARATALATGRLGDHIFCINETSNRRLKVRLTDLRKAEIDMGGAG
jgi:flagella basal body P-ring formation protein FlgA